MTDGDCFETPTKSFIFLIASRLPLRAIENPSFAEPDCKNLPKN